MSDESLEQIERKIAAMQPYGAPARLRSAVLADVQRELRAARWDRRLARAAVVLLVVGVGMNAAFLLPEHAASPQILVAKPKQDSLVQVAISVAEATDVPTGQRVARRLAAMTGRQLSVGELAAMDAAIERRTSHGNLIGKDG